MLHIHNFEINLNKFHYKIDIYSNEQYIKEAKKYNLDDKNIEKIEIPNNLNYDNFNQITIEPNEMYLNLFQNYEYVTNDEKNINLQYTKQISPDDINLTSFLSNTNFFDHLCNICEILLNTGNNNRKKVLLNELKKINKILPSNVYIPFTNNSMRNYVIGSIPISECHIFTTKTRAPYMITLECFRLDEINYYLENSNLNNIPIRKENRRLSDSDIKNKGFKNILKYNFPRKRKYSDDKMDNEKNIKKEKNPLLKNKLIYLYENDIKFSKPLTIKNFLKKDYELINKREKFAKIKNSK